MKLLPLGSVSLMLFMLACGQNAETVHDETAIRALVFASAGDFEQADFASFVSRCSDDLRFFTLDGRSLNKRAALDFFEPMFRRWWERKMTIDSLQIMVDHQLAFARYHSTFSFQSPNGKTNMKNLTTILFRRNQDNEWEICHYHMSTAP